MYLETGEFGRRVKEYRVKAGLSQSELAKRVGVEKTHISRIERGVAACSIDLLLEISDILQISTDYLLKGRITPNDKLKEHIDIILSQLTMIIQDL